MGEALPWLVAAISLAGFAFTVYIATRAGIWSHADREKKLIEGFNMSIAAMRTEMVAAMDRARAETTHNLAAINREMNEGFDLFTNRFSDTVQAVREHVHKLETTTERDFMRKQDYHGHIRTVTDAVNARLDRQDAVIDLIREKAHV